MKLTTIQIRKLIKEELRKVLKEMDYSESMSLDLGHLQDLANKAEDKNIDGPEMQELTNAVQMIGNELFNQKLNPHGKHAKFYYNTVGLIDPDTDMSKISPDPEPDVDMTGFTPEEEPEFY